jgi:hypothetical protein
MIAGEISVDVVFVSCIADASGALVSLAVERVAVAVAWDFAVSSVEERLARIAFSCPGRLVCSVEEP